MLVTREAPHMYFDVDGTLLKPIDRPTDLQMHPYIKLDRNYFLINGPIIKDLRLCRTRGHVCVVWSQGGSDWAEKVVKALALEDYVDIVMAKPSWFIDDKPAAEILDPSRWYDGNF